MDNNNNNTNAIRCHYDVLGVSMDASAGEIKKAHRKLALKLHPDKNISKNSEDEFRLVQQAYECLSDSKERAWYNEHRDAILKGWSTNQSVDDLLFDVVPYQYAGCYSGYSDDDEKSFYSVYRKVFEILAKEEYQQNLPSNFGNSTSDWSLVRDFYASWQSFSSSLNFAWADQYDEMDHQHRRIRRAAAEENKKLRRAARRERNANVQALVHFLKRRDPRVKQYLEQQEEERKNKEKQQLQMQKEKRAQTQAQREEWKRQAQEEMERTEQEDLAAGRVRLADLDSDDEEDHHFYGGASKKKKKKRGKKKNKKQSSKKRSSVGAATNDVEVNEAKESCEEKDGCVVIEDGRDSDADGATGAHFEKEQQENMEEASSESEPDVWQCVACKKDFKSEGQLKNHYNSRKHKEAYKKYEKKQAEAAMMQEEEQGNGSVEDEELDIAENVQELEKESDYSSSSEEEEEPDVWRCVACRKDFKSKGQLENHFKSKKHKEAYRKYEKIQEEEAIMQEMMNDLDLQQDSS